MTEDLQLDGGCLCGAVRFRLTAAAMAVSHCHCRYCRRATGAPFITWMTLPLTGFMFIKGEPKYFHSSDVVRRGFCGTCGSTITYGANDHPEEIDVSAALLEDPEAVIPDDHLWSGSRLSWIRMDDGLPQLEAAHWQHGYPDRS